MLLKKIFPIFYFLTIIVSPSAIKAQPIIIQQSNKIMDDYLHDFFQPTPGRYIAINYADPHGAFTATRKNTFSIIGYDPKLNQVYSTEPGTLAAKSYVGGLEFNSHLYAFSYGNKDVSMSEIDPATGQVKGAAVPLFTAADEPRALIKGFSEDSAYCYLLFKCASYTSKDEIFQGVVMTRNMSVTAKFSFQLSEVKDYIDNTICTLSGKGQLFVVNAIRVKTSKDDFRPLQYFVTEITPDGSAKLNMLNGLPDGRVDNIFCVANTNGFNITGLLAHNEKEGFTTIFTGQFDNDAKKIINQKQNALTSELYWKKVPGSKWREGKPVGIPQTAKLVQSFRDSEGAVTLLMQQKEATLTLRGSFHFSDYYEGSIFAVKIKKSGELAWIQLIPSYKMETPRPIYSGFLAFQQNNKDLLLVYHELEKNTTLKEDDMPALLALDKSRVRSTVLVVVTLKADGTKTSKILDQKEDEDFHIAPHEVFAAYNGEIFVTSYEWKAAGGSHYKPALIQIR